MENNKTKLYGKITDFNNMPLSEAVVRLISDKFEDIHVTYTDTNGNYELEVEKGTYYTFFACKDYNINHLEYWAWNVPIFDNMELNARIDGIEIYALNAFRIQGAHPAISLYFRPMSLKKGKKLQELGYWDSDTKTDKKAVDIFDIAPELSNSDIEVYVDDKKVEVLGVNKTLEYVGKNIDNKDEHMYGYLIQVSLPADYRATKYDYKKIHVVLNDKETGEKGEGSVFWKEPKTLGL